MSSKKTVIVTSFPYVIKTYQNVAGMLFKYVMQINHKKINPKIRNQQAKQLYQIYVRS